VDVPVPRPRKGKGRRLGHVLGSAEWAARKSIRARRPGRQSAECRGAGIGSALLDAVDTEFARLGVDDQVIGVLPGNVDAARVYERRGFRPTWLYLSRFAGRDRAR
jgi:GNAT superfamily N-acetyltransferase